MTGAVLEAWLSAGGAGRAGRARGRPSALIEQARSLADGAAARARGLVRRFVADVARRPAAPLLAPSAG